MPHSTGTGLLAIRAWCEEGSENPLRVEIRLADDVAAGFRSTMTTVHAEVVVEAVRAFLATVVCASQGDPDVLSSRQRLTGHPPHQVFVGD
jgi:hypothetical protein